ncbi:hypothetical protein Fcan01_13114 [Folsomia candida]|uniref:Uncharacterized protein n=2 Tax=Folsomia candida TaxID=158441 RepID=A0A226E3B5_FOLCA|nr:hypothetical protein Fcan01_13114 [Folsomia candida]
MVSDRVKKISPELEFDETFAYDFKHLYLFKEANFVKSASSIKDKLAINSKNYLIAKAFHPLFRIMQILGSLPISIKSTNGMIHYEFHPCSPGVSYRLAVSDDPAGFNISSWVLGANQVFRTAIPVFALINVFAVRLRTRSILQFVNGWTSVLHEFEVLFENHYKLRLVALERSHWVIFPFLVVAYIIPMIRINSTSKRFLLTENWVFNFWSKTTLVVFVASAFVLSTIVTLLSLLTIKSVYRQIRKAIAHQTKETNGHLSHHHVKGWIKLVTLVRDQVDLFVRFGSMPELNDLLFTFVTVLGLSYIAISLYLENMQTTGGSMMPYALGALAIAFLRTFAKGQLADLIVMEEHQIGLDVVAMRVNTNINMEHVEGKNDDAYKTRFEMSVLCNMIFTSPVQIRFANIISLNKKLLLLIISQLASYLVVFLQFKRSPQ